MDNQRDQRSSLYNGVLNHSRLKTRMPPAVVKWDGASRSSEAWDSLRRDPDLWFRDGDCYVYLHGRGQSRRGPAFKVPYLALLEAKFQPLINKFMGRAHPRSNQMGTYDYSEDGTDPVKGTDVHLFIPAPVEHDKRHSYNYHLATRNLFAFIFRRSMVGECLGNTLITLLHSLHQLRTPDANNILDLMSYMNEEGYLDLNGQPIYASAMLLLGETFQLRDLYINAFAHCCGMGDQFYQSSEYQFITRTTRHLIQRKRFEMSSRLRKASAMLKTFLDDEMHRMNIALYPGALEHLKLFRKFLREVYMARFTYYPPQTAIFDADVFYAMRHDFEILYKSLRDENLDISETTQFSIESGMSPLLSLKSFDLRYNHRPLAYPLPLLPTTPRRKASWWKRPAKTSRSRQSDNLAALSRAVNMHHPEMIHNHLVIAYLMFETEQITSTTKAGKPEDLSPVDGRKIRWILIYAIYQTLCQATDVAEEVRDATGAPYHLCISRIGLPPWETRRPASSFIQHQSDRCSLPLSSPSLPRLGATLDNNGSVAINQTACNINKRHGNTIFKESFLDSISRKSSALWHSLNFLAKHESEQSRSKLQKASKHRAAVRGRNKADPENREGKPATKMSSANLTHPPREDPADRGSDSPDRHSHSDARTSDTSDTYVTQSPSKSIIEKWESERASICTRCGLHDVDYGMSSQGASRWPRVGDCGYNPIGRTVQSKLPPAPGRRAISVYEDPHRRLQVAPLNVSKAKEKSTADLDIQVPSPQAPTAWDYIQCVMEVQARNYEARSEAKYNHLTRPGLLIQARPSILRPRTSSASRRASAMF